MDDVRGERLGRRRPTMPPHDYFDSVPTYADTLPDYRRLAREIGQDIAANRPPNVLTHNGRAFWKLTDADSGALAWLAFTRPDTRSALARRKVWTLIPYLQVFMANWFVNTTRENLHVDGRFSIFVTDDDGASSPTVAIIVEMSAASFSSSRRLLKLSWIAPWPHAHPAHPHLGPAQAQTAAFPRSRGRLKHLIARAANTPCRVPLA